MTSDTTTYDAAQPATDEAVRLFDDWFDPIETGLRDRVREFIEGMIRAELDGVLARPRYARRAVGEERTEVTGHRHGSRTRSLMGTFGRALPITSACCQHQMIALLRNAGTAKLTAFFRTGFGNHAIVRCLAQRRGAMRLFSGALLAASLVVACADAGLAQTNLRVGYLLQQDFSDCQNNDVRQGNPTSMGGAIFVNRGSDGNTTVKISLTAARNTTYHFFLKCIRYLGDIQTNEEGVAATAFSFATNETGNIFAFDSYPEGAPAGNKFQSTQIKY